MSIIFKSFGNVEAVSFNGDGFNITNINRNNIEATNINEVVINNNAGILSSETYLHTSRGGLGINLSSVVGPAIPNIIGGVASTLLYGTTPTPNMIVQRDITGNIPNVISDYMFSGTESAPGLSFFSDTNTGFYLSAPNSLGITTNGIKSAIFTPTNTTFTSNINVNSANNQLILGNGPPTSTINAPTPANSRVYSIQDAGSDANFVMTEGGQVIGGAKTFSSSLSILVPANQLLLNTATINTNSTRVCNIPEVGANADFVMTAGAQNINGNKTFNNNVKMSEISNQLTINDITINANTTVGPRTYTLVDAGLNANFVLSEGPQTINGQFTLTTNPKITSSGIILGLVNTTSVIAAARLSPATYSIPDVGTAASFVMTAGAQTIAGVKSFTSNINVNSANNQLILGNGPTSTINAPTPANSRIYSIQDAGSDANFVMTEGGQVIGGAKTFSSIVDLSPTTNQIKLYNTTISAVAAAPRTYSIPDAGTNASFILSTGGPTFTSTVFISSTSNQLVLGTGNTITITAPSPTASLIYTIPDVGSAASFVMTEGNQSIDGIKTFNDQLVLSGLSNQLKLNTSVFNAAGANIYTFQDVGANANVIMSEGTQLINGAKTFSSSINLTSVSNQISFNTVNPLRINAPSYGGVRTYTLPDSGTSSADFVLNAGNQSINGTKTFTNQLVVSPSTNQLLLGSGVISVTTGISRTYSVPAVNNANFLMSEGDQIINGIQTVNSQISIKSTSNQLAIGPSSTNYVINGVTPAAQLIYSIIDVGTAASFVMSAGTQTLTGNYTFSGPIDCVNVFKCDELRVDNTTNQIILGYSSLGTTTTLSAPSSGISRVYTIPDVGSASSSFVMTSSAQTIAGSKTFTSAVIVSLATNQLQLGTTNTMIINAAPAVTTRIHTIPDSGLNAEFVMTAGTQSIAGVKTFTSNTNAQQITCTNIVSTNTTNQLQLGTTQVITLTAPAPTASLTYTIPDVGSAASFVMTAGAQTIAGVKSFTSNINLTQTTNQLQFGTGQVITLTAPTPASSLTYTIPDVGTAASFVMTAGAQTINGNKTFNGAISFASLNITNTSNQFQLGAGNTVTISAPTPAISSLYTIPDVGPSASFVMTAGAQTISGVKSFTSNINLTQTTNQLQLGTGQIITLTAPTPASSLTYTIPDVGTAASFVMTAGAQTIAGVKSFTSNINLTQTTNQLQLGTTNTITITSPAPVSSLTYTIPDVLTNAEFVMTEGNQTITGVKTFANLTNMYTSTANSALVINAATTLFGSGIGSLNVAANSLTVGKLFKIRLRGIYTTSGTGTYNLNLLFGGVSLSTKTTGNINHANAYWEAEFDVIVRSIGVSGTLMTSGRAFFFTSLGTTIVTSLTFYNGTAAAPTTTTVNTTISNNFNVTGLTGAADDSFRCTNAYIDTYN